MGNVKNNVRERVMICCTTGSGCQAIYDSSERFKIDRIRCFIPKPTVLTSRGIPKRDSTGMPTRQVVENVPAGLIVKKKLGYDLTPEEQDVLRGRTKLEGSELWDYEELHGLRYELKGVKFEESSDIFNLDEMMRCLNETIEGEKKKQSILYISITDGTPEYIAAASILAMMNEISLIGSNSDSRMKDTDEEQADKKEKKQRYKNRYIEIKPIKIAKPDELELKCLKTFNSFDEPNERSNTNVIKKLIWTGLWNQKKTGNPKIPIEGRTKNTSLAGKYYAPDTDYKINNKEALWYHRHYIRRWFEEEKWIESIKYTDKYRVKPEAERLINIFCSDAIFDVQKELDKMKEPQDDKTEKVKEEVPKKDVHADEES